MVKAILSATAVAASLLASLHPVAARGVHGMSHGFGDHGSGSQGFVQKGTAGASHASFTANSRRGNDAYLRAASQDRDELLEKQIKSICRGC
jgi:hypothetical protein